jgi:hypothetical protein
MTYLIRGCRRGHRVTSKAGSSCYQAQRYNSRGSTCWVWPLAPIYQIKMNRGDRQRQEKQVATGRGKASPPAIFGVQTRALGFHRGRIGQGREAAELRGPGHSVVPVLVL